MNNLNSDNWFNTNPLISVVIPCRNEHQEIAKCIISIINQKDVPGPFEIIVVDGMSDDGTRDILDYLSCKYSNLKVVVNPKQITPIALNLGINESAGKYICILGAHSEYSENFLFHALRLLNKYPEAACVGGPIISKGKTLFGESTAIAMSSFIGVGNAKHRFPEYEGFAEMACFPVFRREVFNQIGLYDESLVKNQDDEFCFRLRRAGGKVFISPSVESKYYVRDKPRDLFKQYYNYGFWRAAVIRKHRMPISIRQLVPSIFLLFIFFMIVIAFFMGTFWPAIIIPIIYMLILIFVGIISSTKVRATIGLLIPLSIVILHFSYALGTLNGLFYFFIMRTK